MWNIRLELGHHLHPTPMRTTVFAEALASPQPLVPIETSLASLGHDDGSQEALASPQPLASIPDEPPQVTYGPPEWARAAREGSFAGTDFVEQPDGTLRCPADHPLYAETRRRERDGTVRVLYASLELPIVVGVRCGNSVRDTEKRPRDRAA